MSANTAQTLLTSGYPLGFKVQSGTTRSPLIGGEGKDTYTVEARALASQQKEMILSEGSGSVWRLSADEGPAMKGDDLAPFPLGYFIAGVISDLYNRIQAAASKRKLDLRQIEIGMSHVFGSSGSFIHSSATASSEAAEIQIDLVGDVDRAGATSLVADAMAASPAIFYLRVPLAHNTFALYINGRRRTVVGRTNSLAADVTDPFLKYQNPPRPALDAGSAHLIERSNSVESGDALDVPLSTPGKRLFKITGKGTTDIGGTFLTETWIAKAGMRHFHLRSDESARDTAPSGLGLLAAGIAACYLTQLHRYIEAQKLPIRSLRLVQFTPFGTGSAAWTGDIDTHLFLNGDAPEALHRNLLTIAADTCFMHAAASASVEPRVVLTLNGEPVGELSNHAGR